MDGALNWTSAIPKAEDSSEDDVGSEAEGEEAVCFQFINQKILISTIIIS